MSKTNRQLEKDFLLCIAQKIFYVIHVSLWTMVDIYIHNSIKSCKYGKKSGQHGTSSSFETYTHSHTYTQTDTHNQSF